MWDVFQSAVSLQTEQSVTSKSPVPNIYLTGPPSSTMLDSPAATPVQVAAQPHVVAPSVLSAAPQHPPMATMTAVPQPITNVQYVSQAPCPVDTTTSVTSSSNSGGKAATSTNISMHLPTGGITALLPASGKYRENFWSETACIMGHSMSNQQIFCNFFTDPLRFFFNLAHL